MPAKIIIIHVKQGPICLPKPHWITNIRQYRLPSGQDEITRTVQELEKVGIIRPAHSPYNSPIWPVRKLDGTWRMMVDYRELNKVTPSIHVAVPNIASLIDTLSRERKTYHCVWIWQMHSSVFQLLKNCKINLHLCGEAGSGPFRSCHKGTSTHQHAVSI